MRVLALHGFRTNAAILRIQLKPLSTALGDGWSFTCLDAPHPASGEPDDSVKAAFPLEKQLYEWYSYDRQENDTYRYSNLEASVRYVQEVITAGNYDGLLGFSQGGCLAAMLTWMCEHGELNIPTHRRWRFVVCVNAPWPRAYERFSEDIAWCTPTVLMFGKRDKIIDATNWRLQNAMRIETEESHALPRLLASVEAAINVMQRVASRRWFCFDFDGVLCDSARETCMSAWIAGQGIFPESDGQSFPSIELIHSFCKARPLLETGFEALVILYRLSVMKQTPESMLASETPASDMEEALKLMGVSKEELKQRFQKVRDDWIAKDEDAWLAENGFYTPVIEAMNALIHSKQSVYVITTKHAAFATKLLARVGVELPSDRIFGLGSGPKREVLATLAREREAMLGGTCIFIEDRLETLKDVAKLGKLPVELVLAGYGYNTEAERESAKSDGAFVVCETAQKLANYLLDEAKLG